LQQKVKELEKSLAEIATLQKLLPICAYCKKIRNDENYWVQIESYFSSHNKIIFSHGICPECLEKLNKEMNMDSNNNHSDDPHN
jgi:hypothetical protein